MHLKNYIVPVDINNLTGILDQFYFFHYERVTIQTSSAKSLEQLIERSDFKRF